MLSRLHSRIVVSTLVLATLIFVSNIALAENAADWKVTDEHWYAVTINDQPAGYSVQRVSEKGDQLKTEALQSMRIGRANAAVEIQIDLIFVETRRGEPVSISMRQDMSSQVAHTKWEFVDGGVRQTHTIGRTEKVNELPEPEGTWLMPQAGRRYLQERLEADASTITYRTITGNTGLEPSMIEHKATGKEKIKHDGRIIEVWTSQTTDQGTGMSAAEKYTLDGTLVSNVLDAPFGRIQVQLATKNEAMAMLQGDAPELLIDTMVRLDSPIRAVHKAVGATYRLTARNGDLPDLPTTSSQRFERIDDATGTLMIDIEQPLEASESERSDEAYAKSSVLVDSEDALVKKLAERALKDAVNDDVMSQVEAMRVAASYQIKDKGLETAFASASETARTRTGDCSEHAVLLCAMLRSQGIPARVATGLVYVDEFAGEASVFAWHMWTQALVDGRWVDVDATLPMTYHAGHIIASTTPLADGVTDKTIASLLSLIGNLDIEVVEVKHGD